MDIAKEAKTQFHEASAVEQCSCPAGYTGPSCEVTLEEVLCLKGEGADLTLSWLWWHGFSLVLNIVIVR